MILYVGGKAQGLEQAVQERFAGSCHLILYPEITLKERLRGMTEGETACCDMGDTSPLEQASRIAEGLSIELLSEEASVQSVCSGGKEKVRLEY